MDGPKSRRVMVTIAVSNSRDRLHNRQLARDYGAEFDVVLCPLLRLEDNEPVTCANCGEFVSTYGELKRRSERALVLKSEPIPSVRLLTTIPH
jgi:hypothetical protein